jgi:hypothetical protein
VTRCAAGRILAAGNGTGRLQPAPRMVPRASAVNGQRMIGSGTVTRTGDPRARQASPPRRPRHPLRKERGGDGKKKKKKKKKKNQQSQQKKKKKKKSAGVVLLHWIPGQNEPRWVGLHGRLLDATVRPPPGIKDGTREGAHRAVVVAVFFWFLVFGFFFCEVKVFFFTPCSRRGRPSRRCGSAARCGPRRPGTRHPRRCPRTTATRT